MGDIADYYRNHDEEIEEHIHHLECSDMMEYYKLGILKWKPKEGEEILIQDMTNDHVTNVRKHLLRAVGMPEMIKETWKQIFDYEFIKRKLC